MLYTSIIRAAWVVTLLPVLMQAQQSFRNASGPMPWVADFREVRASDVDADGVDDLLFLTNATPGQVTPELSAVWSPGISPAAFGGVPPVIVDMSAIATAQDFVDWIVGDFDGDGDKDILLGAAVTVNGPIAWYLLPQSAPRTFGAPVQVVAQTIWTKGLAGDFNNDGRDDVVLARPGITAPFTYGAIFTSQTSAPWPAATFLGYPVSQLGVGDRNGDGIDDVFYTRNSAGPLTLVLHTGGTTVAAFGTLIPLPTVGTVLTHNFAYADLSFDGTADIVYDAGGVVGVAFGQMVGGTAPTFTMTPGPATIDSTTRFLIGRLDGNNSTDIGIAAFTPDPSGSSGASVFRVFSAVNRSLTVSAIFGPALTQREISAPIAVPAGPAPVADLDGDGDLDAFVVTPNTGGATIDIFENLARFGTATPGMLGEPQIAVSPTFVGDPMFTLGVASARPGALAILGLSTAVAPGPGVLIDVSPAALILVNGGFIQGITLPFGFCTYVTPVPNLPALSGATFFCQWAILDPLGAFTLGATSLALSEGRCVVIE